MRNSCVELGHDELDLVAMGQLLAMTYISNVVVDKNNKSKGRQHQSTVYMHQEK